MRGGLLLIVGFIILVVVFLAVITLINCTSPFTRETAICQPFEPILSYIESFISG